LTRVLAVIGSLRVGGAEVYLTRTAPRLRERGVEIEICALDASGPLLTELQAAGIPVHGTGFLRVDPSAKIRSYLKVAAEIRDLVRRGRFDAVHTYLFWSDVLGGTGARWAGLRRVIMSRRSLHAARRSYRRGYRSLETATNLLAAEVIANSRAVLKDAERSERMLPRRRTVIYNGVDVAGYELARPGARSWLQLVSVGRLAAHKGHDDALRALAELARAGVDARLTFVGDGPRRAEMQQLATALGVESQVEFAGERDPRPALQQADLFILPSHHEGFSNALLEAMASGLPVVATDAGGTAEALGDAGGGRLVQPRAPAALAQALIDLARDRDALAEMGLANRHRVEANFTLDRSCDALAAWYRDPQTSLDSGIA